MKSLHIEIDIDKDGDMLIHEENCTGRHYHVEGAVDDLINDITTCLADYLHYEEEKEND